MRLSTNWLLSVCFPQITGSFNAFCISANLDYNI
nr:MAG TPA: hypothetical protein [Caudoviricetes sp.]